MPTLNPSIYLDYAATTPVAPEVTEVMLPYLQGELSRGNASSIHQLGRTARAAIDTAREQVAELIGADYADIYFTGSGTESDNLAIIGTLLASASNRKHIVTTTIEHHAVLHSAHFLQTLGYEVTLVPVDSFGCVSPEDIRAAITPQTALVSVMHANNEIGTLQEVSEIARIAHEGGAKFHTDAVQTAGLLPLNVEAIGCDLLTLCAHKFYGPKGAGALYIRQGTKVSPILHGGAQEREKRAGTENVPALVGFGKAVQLLNQYRESDFERISRLRDHMISQLQARIEGLHLNGHPALRLPNNVHISVEGVEGATLLMNLDRKGIAASSGAACSSGSIEPSHVLKAIGLPDTLNAGGIRFTLGRPTTQEEVDTAVEVFAEIVQKIRARKG